MNRFVRFCLNRSCLCVLSSLGLRISNWRNVGKLNSALWLLDENLQVLWPPCLEDGDLICREISVQQFGDLEICTAVNAKTNCPNQKQKYMYGPKIPNVYNQVLTLAKQALTRLEKTKASTPDCRFEDKATTFQTQRFTTYVTLHLDASLLCLRKHSIGLLKLKSLKIVREKRKRKNIKELECLLNIVIDHGKNAA